VKVILDTHAAVWWLLGDEQLTMPARHAIADAEHVWVSAASAWEMATKARLGKWPQAALLAEDLERWMARQRWTALPIGVHHAIRAGLLPGPHRDPFDRMIAAQALDLDVRVVSGDAALDAWGIRRIW